jgi:hypothetical protein
MAQDLFQVLDGLQVSDAEIREAEIFSVNYLQPLYPDLDLREGTALRDTSIRAAATLLALARKGFTYYFTINSLANVTDETPVETVDALMSNYFLNRKAGSNSKLVARLYFAISKNVTISSSLFFSTNNEQFFFPVETVSSTADSLEYDSSRQQYYLDVDLESESAGDEYNIESGQILFFSTFDPFFVGGDILFLKERSITTETNTQFVNRAGSAISTRNLINQPSIEERILETFNFFSNVTSVGMGETEMVRDLVTVRAGTPPEFVKIHIGGHVDVYVQSQVEVIEEQFTIDDSINGFILEGDYSPVFDIERVPGSTDTIPFDTEDEVEGFDSVITTIRYAIALENYSPLGEPIEPRHDLGLSSKQRVIIKLLDSEGYSNNHFIGGTATFRMKRVTGLQSLQSFFDNSLSRVLCADLLARSYELYIVSPDIRTHGLTDVGVFTADLYVRKYIDSLAPGEPFVISELLEVLSRDAGIEGIVTPVNVPYTLVKKNLEEEAGTVDSIISPTRLQRFIVGTVSINGESL